MTPEHKQLLQLYNHCRLKELRLIKRLRAHARSVCGDPPYHAKHTDDPTKGNTGCWYCGWQVGFSAAIMMIGGHHATLPTAAFRRNTPGWKLFADHVKRNTPRPISHGPLL